MTAEERVKDLGLSTKKDLTAVFNFLKCYKDDRIKLFLLVVDNGGQWAQDVAWEI